MQRLQQRVLLGVITAVLCGNSDCEVTEYRLDLRAERGVLVRKLTISRADVRENSRTPVKVPEAELQRVAALYPADGRSRTAEAHSFQGRFQGATPQDVGGAGWLFHASSTLGSFSVYSERFLGQDDQAARLKRLKAAADHIVNHIDAWLAAQVQGHPGQARLHRFMDGTFREDLHNQFIYLGYLAKVSEQLRGREDAELRWRAMHMLAERGYLPVDTPAELSRSFFRITDERLNPELMAFVQRRVAREMGVADADPVPAQLTFLRDSEQALASLGAYLKTTPDHAALLKAFAAERERNPNANEPEPLDVLTTPVQQVMGSASPGELVLQLSVPVPPTDTNGVWDQKRRQVSWKATIQGDAALPTLCFAGWSEPDAAAQKRHFGKVVLTGEALQKYVTWRHGLTGPEAEAWEQFLNTLRPGPRLWSSLSTFKLPPDAQPGDGSMDLAATPRRLLEPALAPKKKARSTPSAAPAR